MPLGIFVHFVHFVRGCGINTTQASWIINA